MILVRLWCQTTFPSYRMYNSSRSMVIASFVGSFMQYGCWSVGWLGRRGSSRTREDWDSWCSMDLPTRRSHRHHKGDLSRRSWSRWDLCVGRTRSSSRCPRRPYVTAVTNVTRAAIVVVWALVLSYGEWPDVTLGARITVGYGNPVQVVSRERSTSALIAVWTKAIWNPVLVALMRPQTWLYQTSSTP